MHRYVTLPFAARFVDARWPIVTVAREKLSVDVDLITGAITTRQGGVAGRPALEREGDGLARTIVETEEGPFTDVTDTAGRSVRLAGEVVAAAHRDGLFVAVLRHPGDRHSCVGMRWGRPQERVSLPAGWPAFLMERSVACQSLRCVHHFESIDGRLCVWTLPVPEGPLADVRLVSGSLIVIVGARLLVIDAGALPRTATVTHHAIPLTLEALEVDGKGDPDPAIVRFVFPGRIVAEHPRLGRLTLMREPAIAAPDIEKDDRVVIEDVRENLPGVFRVYAWRKAGTTESVRAAPAPIELEAPAIGPLSDADLAGAASDAGRSPGAAHLRLLSETHGFRAPPLLVRLLEERERDPVFARWLDMFGFAYFEVRGLTLDWNADPCLLAFAGNGGGDEYCLYVYPPACAGGREPIVVEYLHELNFAEHLADDFDTFLDRELAKGVTDAGAHAELASRIRARLGLERRERAAGTAPSWLPRGDGVPEDRERATVRDYLMNDDPSLLVELERIYEELGWGLQLEHVREARAAQ